MKQPLRFIGSCVGWDPEDVHREGGLCSMVDEIAYITRRTFLSHVDRGELRGLERDLSYDSHPKVGLTMAGDWHVAYFRSKLHDKTVYGFQHSAIEFVFAGEE